MVLGKCEMLDREHGERETHTERKNRCHLETQMM